MTKDKIIEAIKTAELPIEDLAIIAATVCIMMETSLSLMGTDIQKLVIHKLISKPAEGQAK